jgi:hypothetical protein
VAPVFVGLERGIYQFPYEAAVAAASARSRFLLPWQLSHRPQLTQRRMSGQNQQAQL